MARAIQDVRRLIEKQDFERGCGQLGDYGRRHALCRAKSLPQFQFRPPDQNRGRCGQRTAGPVIHRIFEKLNVRRHGAVL